MAKTNVKELSNKVVDFFDLERSFIIFSVVYLPIAILFFNQGGLERALLAIYTVLLMGLAGVLLVKFVIYLAAAANEHKSNYGGVFAMYFFQVLIPLVMFKVFGYVAVLLLPAKGMGFCDLRHFVLELYYGVFQYQHSLNLAIAASLAVVTALALWSVGKKN
jgi:hypothetical protein